MSDIERIRVCKSCVDMSIKNSHCRECGKRLTDYNICKSGLDEETGLLMLVYMENTEKSEERTEG